MSDKDPGIVGTLKSLVQIGIEREAGAQLAAANKRIAELEAQVKEQAEALLKPSVEGQKLIDQAMAAVKVHSVRAREAITDGEAARRQVILMKREVEAMRKELEEVKAIKAEEVAAAQAALPVPDPDIVHKVRRSLRRLSPRIR